MQPASEELISISEAARRVGINKSTLSRQVANKSIRSHGGKVRFSEVLEDRANNIDLIGGRRPGPAQDSAPAHVTPDAPGVEPDDDATVMVDGVALPFVKAQALKETYLARLRRQEFEINAGKLIDRAGAEKAFFDAGRDVRDAWLAWPARVATLMASDLGVDAAVLTTVLTRYVQHHLAELGEPDGEFAAAA